MFAMILLYSAMFLAMPCYGFAMFRTAGRLSGYAASVMPGSIGHPASLFFPPSVILDSSNRESSVFGFSFVKTWDDTQVVPYNPNDALIQELA